MMGRAGRSAGLEGKRILVVEDEYFLAADIAGVLRSRGADVIGPVGTVNEAERLVSDCDPDCVILDINLRGDMSYEVADRLAGSGIPFLFATGYSEDAIPERFSAVPQIQKPIDAELLGSVLPAVIDLAA
jgi:CheY-like chemotaxis protein